MNSKYQQISVAKCREIAKAIDSSIDENEIKDKFSSLLDEQPFLNYHFGIGSVFWRGRKCDTANGFLNVSELSYPPAHLAKVGRLNNQNQPMLYLASRKFTAFSEINAKPGDYIHIIGYKIRKNKSIKIGLIGDLFHVYRTGMSMLSSEAGEVLNNKLNSFEYEIGKSIVYVDAYLASILRHPNAKSNNYLHTRILGELLFNKVTEVKSIFYPSVAQEGGMNLAMIPVVADDVLEVVSSSIVMVKDRWEFGMYDFIPIKDCIEITSNGSFFWKLATNPRGYILFNQ
jgi:hypothetical protein